jgi:hypothetical protein
LFTKDVFANRVVLRGFFSLTARSLLATRERSPVFFAGSKSEAEIVVLRVDREILALPTSRQIERSNFFRISLDIRMASNRQPAR